MKRQFMQIQPAKDKKTPEQLPAGRATGDLAPSSQAASQQPAQAKTSGVSQQIPAGSQIRPILSGSQIRPLGQQNAQQSERVPAGNQPNSGGGFFPGQNAKNPSTAGLSPLGKMTPPAQFTPPSGAAQREQSPQIRPGNLQQPPRQGHVQQPPRPAGYPANNANGPIAQVSPNMQMSPNIINRNAPNIPPTGTNNPYNGRVAAPGNYVQQAPISSPAQHPSYPNPASIPGPGRSGQAGNQGYQQVGYPGNANNTSYPGGPGYPNGPGYPGGPGGMPPRPEYNFIQPPKKTNRTRFPKWARITVGALAVLLVIAGIGGAYYQINYADSINAITGHQAIHHYPKGNGGTSADATAAAVQQAASADILNGNRVNILLLGSDNDGKGNSGANNKNPPLAQTDIVITINPATHYVGMLSIPRDMQVTIPGYSPGKMDFAFSYGYQQGNSTDQGTNVGSAAGLAEDTIYANFGIKIDYYAWVGLDGFKKVIDTAGGVDVDVTHPMVDDVYPNDASGSNADIYGYKRLYIAPGPQHLNGVQALEYVRTRHSDLVGDFGRSARQQQVLTQLKTKLATPDVINKASQLLSDLKGALYTDLTLTEMIGMANYARQVNTNNIDRITLGPPTYARSGLAGGNYAPVCSAITPQISKMFGVQGNCIPQADSDTSGVASVNPSTSTAVAKATTVTTTAITTTVNPIKNASTVANQAMSQLTQNVNAYNPNNFTAVHSLLDLMFMGVFESYDAGKV